MGKAHGNSMRYTDTSIQTILCSQCPSQKAIQLCRVKAMTCMRGAEPGSIRGDFCIDVGRNVIHGSDAVESAKREIGLWFPEGLATNKPELKWVYES